MKLLISGKISEDPESRIKFKAAECFVKKLNHTPINPFNLTADKLAPWPDRIEALSSCDGIFLLSDWLSSSESLMEKYYADITGKVVLFESWIESENRISQAEQVIVSRIAEAIQEVTGLTFDQFTEEDRETLGFFCRMIFSIQCLKAGIDDKRIVKYIPRDRTTILHYFKKYGSECKFNKEFREIAEKVNQKLCQDLTERIVQPAYEPKG